jgi:hypothetical protein
VLKKATEQHEKKLHLACFFQTEFVLLQPTIGTQVFHLRSPQVRHLRINAKAVK